MLRNPISLLAVVSILLAVAFPGYGQKAVIRVADQKSGEPVPFAHVCFEGLDSKQAHYGLTSMDGTVDNNTTERTRIAVSYVGYTTFTDTIRPGQSISVKLRPQVLNIDEVVVSAQYSPVRADKSIYKIDVISARQIEQKAANNMADLLRDQSSMQVTQNGVLGTSLRIQGLSGENVKFLQDGVPMIGRLFGNFDLNQINLYNVDHVEVIEGPMSVIYGSNALAGVINIITKENRTSFLNATASTYVESVGVYNFDGSFTMNRGRHGFGIDGGRNFFDGYSPDDTTRSQIFKPRRQYFFDGYYTYATGPLRVKVAGDYFNELLLDKGPLLTPYYETAFDNYFTTIRYTGRADAALTLPRRHFINVLASWSAYHRLRETVFKDLTTLTETTIPQSWAQDTTDITNFVARGTIARSDDSRAFNYQAGFDISVESGTGEKIKDNRQQTGDYAAFLSVRWDPVRLQGGDRVVLSIQPGLRLIYNTKYSAPLVYAVTARWNVTPEISVRGSFSRGFRAPSIKELYLVFVDVNHNVYGNPDLKAENSYNTNMNFNWMVEENKSAWSIDIGGYYNYIENVILLAQTGNSLEYTYQNVSRYRSTGGQLSLSYALYPSFRFQMGISETGITGSPDDETPYPPFKWSTEISCSPSYRFTGPDLTLALFYKFTGATPQLGFNGDQLGWGWVDPYNTMDFTASKGFFNNRLVLSAGVKNIFNTTIVPSTTVSGEAHTGAGGGTNIAWGRTVFARLAFQFNKYK